jgi:hypothetical protein
MGAQKGCSVAAPEDEASGKTIEELLINSTVTIRRREHARWQLVTLGQAAVFRSLMR